MKTEAFLGNDAIGTISYYNVLLFNGITALQSNCEGALAVSDDARFGSQLYGYDIGVAGMPGWESIVIGNHENPNGYPSLLLGGTVDERSISTRVYAGNVAMKLSHQEYYEKNEFRFDCAEGVSFVTDATVENFFMQAKKQVLDTASVLAQGNSNAITMSELRQLGQLALDDYENKNIKTDSKIVCLNLECQPGDLIKISEINFTDKVFDYDTIVINVLAENITFADGAMLYYGAPIQIVPSIYPENQLIQELASRVIFNFPNATEVNMVNYSVIGSIIAPHANVITTGGTINGMLIADSLLQDVGMDIHAFTISQGENLWELEFLTGNVNVVVRDSEDYTTLPEALFSLYCYNEETSEYDLIDEGLATSTDGVLAIKDLTVGAYKLVETHAPKGYALAEITERLFEIKIDNEGGIIQVDTIYIDNTRLRGGVEFLVTDSEDNEIKLEGAVFSLFLHDEETDEYVLVSTGHTTDSDGFLEIEDLLPGDYKLVETTAPDGYSLDETTETFFSIGLDDEGEIVEPETINITNTKLGYVQIVKIDSEDNQIRLPGAQFILKYFDIDLEEYEVIRTGLVTDEYGHLTFENLEPGDYMLVEIKAPHGYKLPDDAETLFTVTV